MGPAYCDWQHQKPRGRLLTSLLYKHREGCWLCPQAMSCGTCPNFAEFSLLAFLTLAISLDPTFLFLTQHTWKQ